jgi:hypothetical protein
VKEKPAVRSPFFGAFPSDRTPKGTKEDNVNFFIYSFTFRDAVTIIELAANAGDFLKLLRMHMRVGPKVSGLTKLLR